MNLILHDFCLWCADAKYGKTLTLIYNIAMNESLKLNDGNDLFDERKKTMYLLKWKNESHESHIGFAFEM